MHLTSRNTIFQPSFDDFTELWDEDDGLFYDRMLHGGCSYMVKVHSLVSLVPLFAACCLESTTLHSMPNLTAPINRLIAARQGKHVGVTSIITTESMFTTSPFF